MMDRVIPTEKTIEASFTISNPENIKNEMVKNNIMGIAIKSDVRFIVTRYQSILLFSIIPPYPNLYFFNICFMSTMAAISSPNLIIPLR